MVLANTHIIKKQVLAVEIPAGRNHQELSEEINQLFYQKLKPQLEKLLDQLAPPDVVYTLDRLHLDLGTIAPEQLNQEFPQRFLTVLEKVFKKITPEIEKTIDTAKKTRQKKPAVQQSVQTQLREVFTFFLEKGHLPWWYQVDRMEVLEEQVHTHLLLKLPTILRESRQLYKVCRRMTTQLSYAFFQAVVRSLQPDILPLLPTRPLPSVTSAQILVKILSEPKVESTTPLLQSVKQLIQDRELPKRPNPILETTNDSQPLSSVVKSDASAEEIYIQNAGMIILWPFLERFFEVLGLVEEGQFVDIQSQEQAVLLLEYLTTGRQQLPEYDLVLPKLLCAYPLEEPIANTLVLRTHEMEEALGLLNAVIQHWGALKSTGPTGLQEAFLQREGKLSRASNGWSLQVEQKAYDFLLGQLPWGIGMLQLRWMSELLIVEWH